MFLVISCLRITFSSVRSIGGFSSIRFGSIFRILLNLLPCFIVFLRSTQCRIMPSFTISTNISFAFALFTGRYHFVHEPTPSCQLAAPFFSLHTGSQLNAFLAISALLFPG